MNAPWLVSQRTPQTVIATWHKFCILQVSRDSKGENDTITEVTSCGKWSLYIISRHYFYFIFIFLLHPTGFYFSNNCRSAYKPVDHWVAILHSGNRALQNKWLRWKYFTGITLKYFSNFSILRSAWVKEQQISTRRNIIFLVSIDDFQVTLSFIFLGFFSCTKLTTDMSYHLDGSIQFLSLNAGWVLVNIPIP